MPPTDRTDAPSAVPPDGTAEAELVARLRRLGSAPVPAELEARHLAACAREAAGRRRHGRIAVAAVAAAGLVLGSTSLAAAGVLPAPAQSAMSTTLRRIGVEVPEHGRRGDEREGRRRDTGEGAGAGVRAARDEPRDEPRDRAEGGRRAEGGAGEGAERTRSDPSGDTGRDDRGRPADDEPTGARPSPSAGPSRAAPAPTAGRDRPDPPDAEDPADAPTAADAPAPAGAPADARVPAPAPKRSDGGSGATPAPTAGGGRDPEAAAPTRPETP